MTNLINRNIFLSIIILCWCTQLQAQHSLQLRNVKLEVAPNTTKWLDSIRTLGSKEPTLALIHFNTLPTAQQKQTLLAQGISLLDYLPGNTYTAFVQPTTIDNNAAALKGIYGITSMRAEWKADNYVWKKVNEAKGNIEVLTTFYPGISTAAIKQFVSAIGAQINAGPMERYSAYKIVIAADRVRAMAGWYGVQNISPVTDMVQYDLQSRPTVKGNIALASPVYGGYGLTGDSVAVGVGDNSSGILHADIKDRITNFNPGPMRTHGAHVNGIVGGAGTVDPMAEGMAPHALLLDYMYDQIIPATGPMLHDYNMTITNNSYGVLLGDCDYSGTYDGYSRFLDTISVQYPEVLHVFASGNDGWMSCSPYLPGFATVGGGYQPAKNNVVVGSMTDFLAQAADQSRGPTRDGRMKPEVIAIGLGAYSTIGIDDYEWAAGTSMAAPQVAGGLAVLTQRYKQLHSNVSPRADVLKTILLNGTMDLGNPGPDFSYGYGAMDLSRSLKILDNNSYYINNIANADSQTASIVVPANTAQLKVMLCWHDVPASTASATQLVNDLDLSVTTPSSSIRLPLVCDPTPANVNNIAVERADHLNNVEQITITDPAAGTYSIKVKGFNVPFPNQRYVVAYDLIPAGTQLTFPIGGEQLGNQDSIRIFWNTVSTDSTFKVEFSKDNGSSWTTIGNNIPGVSRYCSFKPSGINSGNCLVRIRKNGSSQVLTSGRFAINEQAILQLQPAQCPGYVNIHWSPVPNATSYELLAKKGKYMQIVGTTTDTIYSFNGMSLTEKSYLAVRPIINGIQGYRSKALITIANNGTCTDPVSAGDLMIEKAVSPVSGRMYTSTQLSNNEILTIQLRNLYTATATSYTVAYSINGGAWNVAASTTPISGNSPLNFSIPGIDLSAPGSYAFTVALQNLSATDPQHANDTLRYTVNNILNDTLTLPFIEDFEGMAKISITGRDSLGLSANGHWDFKTNDSAGRMRSFVNEGITIAGTRSVSLDENQAVSSGSNNLFTGTFNLATYDTATTEVRLDFNYILHGTPKTAGGNVVTARPNDAEPWLPVFTYDLNAYPGTLNQARSISITDLARSAGRNFSSSLQITFGQNDTSLIAARNYGNGLTIDNLKLYTVANDAELVKVLSPLPTNCGIATMQPLTVQVHNGVNYTLRNLQLFYQMDGGTIFTGSLDSITAKNTVEYTFAQLLNMPAGTSHSVNVWLNQPGDTYLPNDTILNYHFRNNQVFTSYPYLENFEAGDGGYYTDGINNSWQYGTPVSDKINKAASGAKAWKTNLAGRYNNLEQSYLYSPCFEISGMTDPMLSFSAALDIEDCGSVLCDKAYIEYTYNGITWNRLGTSGNGTNWYDPAFNGWTRNGFTRWHVASIPIPKPVGSGSVINFRFVLSSDPGATFEGFAVDDIHIFDKANSILPATGTTVVANNISRNNWIPYLHDNHLLAAVQPQNQDLGNTTITLYEQASVSNPGNTQYVVPRNYTINAAQDPADSITLRLYLTESDFLKILDDTICPSCPIPADAYRLGITQYNNMLAPGRENNSLNDDTGGTFTFTDYRKVQWVPYDNGYAATFKTRTLAELWFNDGGPSANFPAGIDYLNFAAYRSGITARLYWTSLIDTAVSSYTLERSIDGITFSPITTIAPQNLSRGVYNRTDDIGMLSSSDIYYRLSWTMTGRSTVYYSPVRKLSTDDSVSDIVKLNAQMIRHDAVLAEWTSYIDGIVDHYTLERRINGQAYTTINTTTSLHRYAQYYSFTDLPGDLQAGALVRYKLTAHFDDGTYFILPERTVEWTTPNTVTEVYPNPSFDGLINIVWYAEAGTMMQVNLTDMAGKTIYGTTVQAGQWRNTSQVQTSYKPIGMYLLQTIIGNKRYTAKVVFE